MADILTLAEARSAVGPVPAADTTPDADLTSTYIPATTATIEDVTGPIMAATGVIWTTDGGQSAIVLPSAVTAVASVVESGVLLTEGTDYTVNKRAGMILRGTSTQTGATFKTGQQNVVITYSAGSAADPTQVAANVKLAARIIIRYLWLADRVGRPQMGTVDVETVNTPSGMPIPKRAMTLLAKNPRMPGFA